MLSYSFSDKCSTEHQSLYLTLAKEAFEIGLLTNTAEKTVTSKLELHTLLRASYCLTLTHRWMTGLSENITTAMRVCHEAVTLLFEYSCRADFALCADITAKIEHIKSLLKVKSFGHSDPHSFVPDSYRSLEFGPVPFALGDFAEFIDRFRKHHGSVCETFEMNALRTSEDPATTRCITAFQIDTEATAAERSENPEQLQETHGGSVKDVEDEFMEQSLRSKFPSRQNSSSSGSSFVLVESNCRTEMGDDEQSNCAGPSKQKTHNTKGFQRERKKATRSVTSLSSDSSYEHIPVQPQSSIETVEDVLDPSQLDCDVTSLSVTNREPKVETFDSFSSRSSWEKLSVSPVTNTCEFTRMNRSRLTSSHAFKLQERVKAIRPPALSSTETDPFEELGFPDRHREKVQTEHERVSESCHRCFKNCVMGSDVLTERDYRCLFAGVCHGCLMERLPNKPLKSLDSRRQKRAYGECPTHPLHELRSVRNHVFCFRPVDAVVLKYSKASDVWTGFQSSVFIGERTGDCGTQRRAVEVLYLHQEQLLSR